MPSVFTPELVFGRTRSGILTPAAPAAPYRTISPGLGAETWDDSTTIFSADSARVDIQRYRLQSIDGSLSGAIGTPVNFAPGDQYFVCFTIFSIATLGGGARIGNTGVAMTALGINSDYYIIEAGGTIFIKRFAGITDMVIGDVTARKVQ